MDVALAFLAGVHEDKPFHDEDQQESGQDGQAGIVHEHFADLRQHVKKTAPSSTPALKLNSSASDLCESSRNSGKNPPMSEMNMTVGK